MNFNFNLTDMQKKYIFVGIIIAAAIAGVLGWYFGIKRKKKKSKASRPPKLPALPSQPPPPRSSLSVPEYIRKATELPNADASHLDPQVEQELRAHLDLPELQTHLDLRVDPSPMMADSSGVAPANIINNEVLRINKAKSSQIAEYETELQEAEKDPNFRNLLRVRNSDALTNWIRLAQNFVSNPSNENKRLWSNAAKRINPYIFPVTVLGESLGSLLQGAAFVPDSFGPKFRKGVGPFLSDLRAIVAEILAVDRKEERGALDLSGPTRGVGAEETQRLQVATAPPQRRNCEQCYKDHVASCMENDCIPDLDNTPHENMYQKKYCQLQNCLCDHCNIGNVDGSHCTESKAYEYCEKELG